jgi:hypothetical protein
MTTSLPKFGPTYIFDAPHEKLFLPILDFRVDVPSFLAGAAATLAFLVLFSVSIKLFFFMTNTPSTEFDLGGCPNADLPFLNSAQLN